MLLGQTDGRTDNAKTISPSRFHQWGIITKLQPIIAKTNDNFNNLTFKVKVIYEWRSGSVWLFLRDILEDYYVKFEDNPFKNNSQ
jgi:hypothetical protein